MMGFFFFPPPKKGGGGKQLPATPFFFNGVLPRGANGLQVRVYPFILGQSGEKGFAAKNFPYSLKTCRKGGGGGPGGVGKARGDFFFYWGLFFFFEFFQGGDFLDLCGERGPTKV